jgi:hypothetical protein
MYIVREVPYFEAFGRPPFLPQPLFSLTNLTNFSTFCIEDVLEEDMYVNAARKMEDVPRLVETLPGEGHLSHVDSIPLGSRLFEMLSSIS